MNWLHARVLVNCELRWKDRRTEGQKDRRTEGRRKEGRKELQTEKHLEEVLGRVQQRVVREHATEEQQVEGLCETRENDCEEEAEVRSVLLHLPQHVHEEGQSARELEQPQQSHVEREDEEPDQGSFLVLSTKLFLSI